MFCPNCGKDVPSESNFCPNCGKNLKKVKVYIDKGNSKSDELKPNKSSNDGKTIVFKPLNLDGIDSTKEISNIIKEVDNKISENINKYATSSQKKLDAEVLNHNQKKSEEKSLEKDSDPEKQKFSLKKWWNNFINEGEDEFSIFASIDESKENNDDKIELSTSSTSSDTLTGISADTLSIPKETMEAKLAEIDMDMDENKSLKDIVEEKKEDILEKLEKEHKHNSKIISEESIKPKKEKIKIRKTKLKEPEEKLSIKSFTDMVNEELKKIENNKEKTSDESDKNKTLPEKSEDDSDKIDSTFKNEIKNKNSNNPKNTSSENSQKKSFTDQVNEELKKMEKSKDNNSGSNNKYNKDFFQKKISSKKNKNKENKNTISKNDLNNKLNNFFNIISDKVSKFDALTKSKGKKSLYSLITAGVVITLLPLIIAEKGISLAVIMLLIFKLLFGFLEFYFSLKIATEKISIDTTTKEVKYFAFENWFICQVFLFAAYILSPWNGFFNFTLLPALTPLPIAMIILFLMSISISFGQYWHKLKYENKINFAGWYIIPFILIHFTSKLFFLFFNLIV